MAMVAHRFDVYLVNLDQIRTIDKTRLIKKIGTISPETQLKVIKTLQQLFSF